MARLSLLIFFLPVLAHALSVSDERAVKLYDGAGVSCSQPGDLYRDAYQVREVRAAAAGDVLTIVFGTRFVLCDLIAPEQMAWVDHAPYAPVAVPGVDGQITWIFAREGEAQLFYPHDLTFERLATAPVAEPVEQSLTLRFPWARALSAAERAALERGEPVRIRLELYVGSIRTAKGPSGEYGLGWRHGGGYTVFVTLRK